MGISVQGFLSRKNLFAKNALKYYILFLYFNAYDINMEIKNAKFLMSKL